MKREIFPQEATCVLISISESNYLNGQTTFSFHYVVCSSDNFKQALETVPLISVSKILVFCDTSMIKIMNEYSWLLE